MPEGPRELNEKRMNEAKNQSSEPSAGYSFAFAARGKHYGGSQDRDAVALAPRVRAWAPLFNFPWRGASVPITENVSIISGESYKGYESDALKRFLSLEELDECRDIAYWLQIDQSLRDQVSIRVRMNSFLLALWLARPTRSYIAFRFEEVEAGEHLAARILDRFQWIEGYVSEDLSVADLQHVRISLPSLVEIYEASRRLRNALMLTFRARVSSDWQSSYVCLTAAAEALLTYSQGPGLVGRLADAFSRLTSASDSERKAQRDHFKHLYSVRSKIMHGRSHDRRNAEANLRDLAAMDDALRRLWNKILESSELRAGLDAGDESRLNLFNAL